MASECSWCGTPVEAEEGLRAAEPEGERVATFCRLEHVVPWVMQGAHWEPGVLVEPDAIGLGVCACCGDDLDDRRVLLVRHRGEHRIGDAFCSTDHLLDWARRGGRFAPPR